MKIYLIGSLRNLYIPALAKELRAQGYDVFDDWHCPGPSTDDYWQAYEKDRGRSYKEALNAPHAWNVYEFDKRHLDAADAAVLVMPAGKSAHLELGYMKGSGKRTYVLFDEEPERWDVMYRFADQVCFTIDELVAALNPRMSASQRLFEYTQIKSPKTLTPDRQCRELPDEPNRDPKLIARELLKQ